MKESGEGRKQDDHWLLMRHCAPMRYNTLISSPSKAGTTLLAVAWLLLHVTAAGAKEHLTPQQLTPSDERSGSRFERTVRALQGASADQRSRFATTALAALIEVYVAESDLASQQAKGLDSKALHSRRSAPKLHQWARAVDDYASQLLLIANDLDLGMDAELRFTHQAVVAVVVSGNTIILSHPRLGQQHAFEHRLLTEFCGRNDCEALTEVHDSLEPISLMSPLASPDWQFSQAGPICSYREVWVRFSSRVDLAKRKEICAQFMQEVNNLASELIWQRRHGVLIEWESVSIDVLPQRPGHLVTLNGAGDTLLVTVPVLYRSANALALIKPWLESNYEGKALPRTALDARALGWE